MDISELREGTYRDILDDLRENSSQYDYWLERVEKAHPNEDQRDDHSFFNEMVVQAAIDGWDKTYDSWFWSVLLYAEIINEEQHERYAEDR